MTMLRDAITTVALAPDGQTDKIGAPYIFHPLRVASTFSGQMLQVIAVLHDLVENTDTTLSDLDARLPQSVINTVEALTRRSEESYKEFIDRLARNPNARLVTTADIRDNLRPGAEHLRPRYEAALKVLEQD